MNQPTLTTSARTILRIVTGFLFAAHGWQKFNEFTIAGTQAAFAQMGVPAANVAAPVVATLELVGGVALILGVLTRVFAALLAVNMLGALFLVHASGRRLRRNRRLRTRADPGRRRPGRGPRRRGQGLRGQGPLRPQRLQAQRPGLRHSPAPTRRTTAGGHLRVAARRRTCRVMPAYGAPDSVCVAGPRRIPAGQ